MSQEYEKHQKELKNLKSQKFACEPDAMQAAKKLLKKSKYPQGVTRRLKGIQRKEFGKCSYKRIELSRQTTQAKNVSRIIPKSLRH